jgi:hypothetical protein
MGFSGEANPHPTPFLGCIVKVAVGEDRDDEGAAPADPGEREDSN